MVRLTRRQRDVFADKLPQVGNIGMGLLVFGQFVSQQPFSPLLFVAGVALWMLLMALAVFAAGGTR